MKKVIARANPAVGSLLGRVMLGAVLFMALEAFILTQTWGVIALVIYYVTLLLLFQPLRIIHPNMFFFGYYFLWLVCPSMVDFIFYLVDWEFVLPWGRLWDWSSIDGYVLVQMQLSMTVLVVVTYFSLEKNIGEQVSTSLANARPYFARLPRTTILSIVLWAMILFFMQASGGISAWLNNYSETYLTGRSGLGIINVTIAAMGSFAILLAGLRNFGRNGGMAGILPILPLITAIGFVGGFKSRLITLLLFFFLPYLIVMPANLRRMVKYSIGFFAVLYLLTLIRSEGFYSGGARFLELIPTYFNAYPLHDLIVTTEAPGVLQTAHFPFVKITQTLGLSDLSAEYDISIMLTKNYFPDQWYLMNATQQWPLETELYLNYFGVVGQSVPLALYALYIAFLFRLVLIRHRWRFYPILALELFRIISTMRGVLIPWVFPILIIQYLTIYGLSIYYFPLNALKQTR